MRLTASRGLVCLVTFLFAGILCAQEWLPRTVPGAKNPAEISGADIPNAGYFFSRIFTISDDDGGGTRLDLSSWLVGDVSKAVTTRISTSTSLIFGMSHKIAYSSEDAAYVAYIDGGKVMALRSTDGGESWTSSTVADSPSYAEAQISFTTLGVLIAAYNFRLHQIEMYRFVAESLVWNSMGPLLAGKVFGGIDSAPRMTLDGDERKGDIILGWAQLFPGGCTYWVGRFSLPDLTPIGPPIRIPVVYSTSGVKELQMVRAGDYLAGLSAVGNRYTMFSLQYKVANPTVTLHDLGAARPNTVGGIAMTEGGERSWYTATATPAGDIDFRQYVWDSMGVQMRPLPSIRGAHPDSATRNLPYNLEINGRGSEMRMRHYYPGSLRVAEFTGCVDSRRRLCSNGHRFDISVNWRDPQGTSGFGRAVPLTSDTGYYWFFNEANIEMVIKVLNGCAINQRYWVFAGGLTNVEAEITVRDTQTGVVKTYRNPLGTAFQPIQDTSAFEGCSTGANLREEEFNVALDLEPTWSIEPQQGGCSPNQTALCLSGNRFRVESNWRTSDGNAGTGKAVRLTDDSGYFWFFNASNVELITKVLDACSFSGQKWVFAGGLTNVEVEIVVTDMQTGAVKRYTNAQGNAFQPIQDTAAFSSCP